MNPELPTGAIDINAHQLEIFSRAETPPFLVKVSSVNETAYTITMTQAADPAWTPPENSTFMLEPPTPGAFYERQVQTPDGRDTVAKAAFAALNADGSYFWSFTTGTSTVGLNAQNHPGVQKYACTTTIAAICS